MNEEKPKHGGARKGAGQPRKIIRLDPRVALMLRDLTRLLNSAKGPKETPFSPDEIVNGVIQETATFYGVASAIRELYDKDKERT